MDLKTLAKLVTSSVLVVAVSACETKKSEKTPSAKDPAPGQTAPTVKVSVDPQMDAQALVDAGEQLIGPYTFNLADKTFEMALAKDPTNKKAQFYRAFLKRVMVFKGILIRAKPYARAYGNIEGLEGTIKAMPNHPMKKFLMDGKEDIKDVTDIQKFLVDYRRALEEFRSFISKNPDLELDLYMNPSVFGGKMAENARTSCEIIEERSFVCSTANLATAKINAADLVALKQEAAGEILYMALYTSYSVQGIEPLLIDIDRATVVECKDLRVDDGWGGYYRRECVRPNRQISLREKLTRLDQAAGFGHLKADQTMTVIRSLGVDLLAAGKWALQYQQTLCRTGGPNEANRPGYLVSQGLCAEDATEAKKSIALFENLLAGPIVHSFETSHGTVSAEFNPWTLFDKPVKDLRQLMPSAWSRCDSAASFRDKTLGGTFPRGDAENVMIEPCGN